MTCPRSSTAIAIPLATALVLVICLAGCGPSKRDLGNAIVSKIEEFRRIHGRLPNSLSEVAVEESESGPYYFCKSGDNNYILWYGTSLGESDSYNSQTKKWSEVNEGVCSS